MTRHEEQFQLQNTSSRGNRNMTINMDEEKECWPEETKKRLTDEK